MKGKVRQVEKILKALANQRRLKIVQYLHKEKEAPVGDIADTIKLSVKATSKHLLILSIVDIVESEQRSTQVFYYLSSLRHPLVQNVLNIL